jgi:hypothetical protein
MEPKQWQRTINGQEFLVSTSRDLLPDSFVQSAFDHPDIYWAQKPSAATTKQMLDNSCTLGLYKLNNGSTPSQTCTTPIGFARLVTDHVTFAYLTDVFILDGFRKLGLGKWLIHCCREVVAGIPDLRWMLLFTGSEGMAHMYQRELGMQQLGKTENGLFSLGARGAQIRAVAAAASEAAGAENNSQQ